MMVPKKSTSLLVKVFNVVIILVSIAKIIHNERIKRDLENYKIEQNQPYKIRHIIIDHFRSIYLEQHMKHWLAQVKDDFLNIKEANTSITIPEAIQKFYTFFHKYKKSVRNYFEDQFIQLPKEEKVLIKNELVKYISSLGENDRVKMRYVHKVWEIETEIDHSVEDQLESIYDALDSINIIADVNFYNHLRKYEDPKDMNKKAITPWEMGVYLHNLNEGLISHVEKEADYDVAKTYQKKREDRKKLFEEKINKMNETLGVYETKNVTTTPQPLSTLV